MLNTSSFESNNLKMPTRSGKPYQDPKRKKAKNKNIASDPNMAIEKDIENNINFSNLSGNRDLKIKRHKVKQSLEKATGSNWIVSDLSNKVKQTHSQGNTAIDCNLTALDNGDSESLPESNLTTSTRKLRSRKVSDTEITTKVKKNKVIGRDAVAFSSINNLEMASNSQNKYENDFLRVDNDLSADNAAGKKLKKKKNNVKNSKKKKQIIQASPEKSDIDLNTRYKKGNENDDTDDINTKRYDRGELNSPNKHVQSRECHEDSTFEIKEDKIVRQFEKDNRNVNMRNNLEDFTRNSADSVNKNFLKITSTRSSFMEQQDVVNDISYDKNKNASYIKIIDAIADLDQNNFTSPIHCLRRKKSENRNTFKTAPGDIITNQKDEESKRSCVNGSITSKVGSNLKVEELLSASPKSRKRKISIVRATTTLDDQNKLIDTTYELDKSIDKGNTSAGLNNDDLNASNVEQIHGNIATASIKINDMNTTYEKDDEIMESVTSSVKDKNVNVSYDNESENTFDKETSTSFDTFKKGAMNRKSSVKDNNCENNITKDENILSSSASKRKSFHRRTLNINYSDTVKLDSSLATICNIDEESKLQKTAAYEQNLNATFDKNVEGESKSSLISLDSSVSNKYDLSCISVTSDDTEEHIINTTPMLVESIINESSYKEDSANLNSKRISHTVVFDNMETPLKREGTFTKDGPEVQVQSPKLSSRRDGSPILPTAGCTPYHISKTDRQASQKKSVLNLTRSIEKKMSGELAPRMTRVMFCSPVDNPTLVEQEKRKIIKSNLKGSNKSFVFDEDAVLTRPTRKRSYTHSDVETMAAKRSRLTDDLQNSVNRLSRPRTTSATGALSTPKKVTTPSKAKSESKPMRTRLPNFGALHQKEFAKMESLDEFHERKAKRARQMLTASGSTSMLERISPKNNTEVQKSATKDSKKLMEKMDTPIKKLPTLESLRPGYTKFGFKLNLNINPFSVPPKTERLLEKPTEIPRGTLPSLTGTTGVKRGTAATRREAAKNAIMREKSNLEKRNMNRSENRTIIKGVRTNRRFELQMKLRNMN